MSPDDEDEEGEEDESDDDDDILGWKISLKAYHARGLLKGGMVLKTDLTSEKSND